MAFFGRIFKELIEYCDSNSDVSEPLVFDYIQQLLENESTPMPEEFLDSLDSKMGIFKKLKLKIQDEEVKKNIDQIWIRWSRILFDKERREEEEKREEEGQRRNEVLFNISVFSPSCTNTPSVASVIFSPSPLNSLTPVEDRVIENVSIPVYKEMNSDEECSVYKYCRKQSGKVVCMTDKCSSKRNCSVTLQTLRCHAKKIHSIELYIKQRRGVVTNPIICQICSKPFTREQTLKKHIEKFHRSGPVPVPAPPTSTVNIPTPGSCLDIPPQSGWEETIESFLTHPQEINMTTVNYLDTPPLTDLQETIQTIQTEMPPLLVDLVYDYLDRL